MQQQPLHRMMIHVKIPRELDANLTEALRLNDSVENDQTLRAPASFVALTKQSLASPVIVYKIGTLLCWIVFHPAVRTFFGKGLAIDKYTRFVNILSAEFDMFILGKKSSGEPYKPGEDLSMAEMGPFVHRIICLYHERCL
jgi:hypothetical protein